MICTVGSIYWAQKKQPTDLEFFFFSYLNDMKTENVCWLPRQMLIIRSTKKKIFDLIVNMILVKYDIGVQVTSFKLTVRYYTFGQIVGIFFGTQFHRIKSIDIVLFEVYFCHSHFWKEKKLFFADWKVSWCVRSIIPLYEQAYLLSVQCTHTGPYTLGPWHELRTFWVIL